MTASVPLGRHSENEAPYASRAQRARLHFGTGLRRAHAPRLAKPEDLPNLPPQDVLDAARNPRLLWEPVRCDGVVVHQQAGGSNGTRQRRTFVVARDTASDHYSSCPLLASLTV